MAASAPLGAVDDPTDAGLDLDDPLGALVLALMSRLLTARAVGAVVVEGGLRVEVAKGRLGVAVGEVVGRAAEAGGLPPALEAAGLTFAVPLRHGGEWVGLVALGPKLSGEPYAPAEVGLARSLAGATAASLAARQSAAALVVANRALASRAHALRTLFELAQAFGRALDHDAIVNRLAYALMGQLLVRRVAVALCDSDATDGPLDTVLVRGAEAVEVPRALCEIAEPAPLHDANLVAEGWRWVVPLRAGDVTRGAILLGPPAWAESDWTPDADTTDFTAALAALAVGALETADRVEERLERERMREEVRLAREVQARLLPEALPALPGLDLAAQWRPSRDVSGDTYHAADLGGRALVAVADVVGKGIGASLLMATLQAGFRLVEPEIAEAADLGAALEAATAKLDRLVRASTEAHQFVTLAWAVVDPSGDVWSVVAGHPAPRLLRAGGGLEPLAPGGPLLGVLPGAAFAASHTRLGPGDALVFYSDGATEARSADDEELGFDGLDRVLRQSGADTADALVATVVDAVDRWAAGADAEDDDLTVVAVRREG
jgi:sigma-B regulation protein RsbU (phosphoserine phosphatase)